MFAGVLLAKDSPRVNAKANAQAYGDVCSSFTESHCQENPKWRILFEDVLELCIYFLLLWVKIKVLVGLHFFRKF